ncbi:GW dipeptide domain-containing protein [Pediococcus siamensis]|uniref:GW dipeptide domain-containing protein n=1 Tax=Pediococcus siamensis TaxID=381829 RepID=UPI0039A01B10
MILKQKVIRAAVTATAVLALGIPAYASTTHSVTGNKAVSHTTKVVIRKYRAKSSKKRIYTLKSAGHGRYTLKAKYYVHSFTKFTLQRTAKVSGSTYYEVKSPAGYTGWIWSGYLGDTTTYYSKLSASQFQVKANATNNFYNHVPGGDYGKGSLTHYGKNYRGKTMTVTGEAKKVYKTHYYRLTYKGKNFGWIYGGALQKVTAKPAVTEKTVGGIPVYTQSAVALQAFNSKSYSVVNNANYFVKVPSSYGSAPNYPDFMTTPNTIKYAKGAVKTNFTTDVYLPGTVKSTNDFINAQSVVMDGSYAYVMYADKQAKKADQGFVVKYNLAKLRSLIKSSKDYSLLRRAAYHQLHKTTLSANEKAALACMTIGPTFTTGHGQAMALNPKTGKIWFIGKSGTSTEDSNLQELNTSTLKPDKEIVFKMGQYQNMPNNLTFDKDGNFYAYVKNGASWAPSNSVKIYKGTINANNTVQMNLVMQGLRYMPGTHSQSIGYNAKNNRLYFVSDGSISSVPVNKLGKLSAGDVQAENFNTLDANNKVINTREFEGLVFDNNGAGYLLTLRGVELMKATSSNF